MSISHERYEVVIIGAGMAGASLGYELAQDRRVLLLEAEPRAGYHATGRSAAIFAEAYGSLPIRQLTVASRSFLERPPAGFAESSLVKQRGILFMARSDQLASLENLAESNLGLSNFARLDAPALRARVPVLRMEYAEAGLCDEAAMDLDVAAIHAGYLRGFRQRGGVLCCDSPLRGAVLSGGLWRGDSGQRTWVADLLVNAAGAWADEVAVKLGAKPQSLVPKRRTAILIDAPTGMQIESWPLVIDIDEEFYFKPDAGRLFASPADETPSLPSDAAPEEVDIATAAFRIEQCTTIQITAIRHRWAGLRTFAPDKLPIIGIDPQLPQLFWLAGQGGYGIQTAPAIARLAASLIDRRPLPPELEALGFASASVLPRNAVSGGQARAH
jgi:D-arginine dehydrogenase